MLESTLALLYTDPDFRNRFMVDSMKALIDCDLSDSERESLFKIDKTGLLMASRSFFHKRKKRFSAQSYIKKLLFRLKKASLQIGCGK